MKIIDYTRPVGDNKAARASEAGETGRGVKPWLYCDGRVIDLAAWKAGHPDACPEAAGERPAPSPGRSRRSLMDRALRIMELLATLCVLAVLAALVMRILA